ncbi:MAG: DUF4349 domain-containing protein [Hominicoprocola sp.]
MKKLFAILLALMMALSMAACGAAGQSADTAAPESYQFSNKADYETLTEEAEYWDGGLYGETQTTAAHSGAKKIYRATLELQTLEFEKANADIAALVEQYGGYFEEKSLSTYSSSYRYANYTVRVPAAQFESFCAQVGDLCHVTYTTSSAEDISETYYDTKARLETAQIKLERLQELLKKADNMADIITIESAISETEYAIDALSGTLRSYDSLVDYATIYLNLEEVYRLSNTVDAPKTFGEKLGNAFADGVKKAGELLESIAIWLAYNWLTLIIWAVILTAVILLVRRVRRGVKLPKVKLGKKKQITAQTEENDRTEE